MKPYVFILLFVCYVGHAQYNDVYDWREETIAEVVTGPHFTGLELTPYTTDTWQGWNNNTQLYNLRDDRPIMVFIITPENLDYLPDILSTIENMPRGTLIWY